MLRNYLKTALRNLRKTPALSLVNILGLSAGLTFLFLIGAYIWGEWTVNAGMPDGDRLYIVRSEWKDPSEGLDMTTAGPIAEALHEQYPQLVTGYFHHDAIGSIVSRGDKHFHVGLMVGDPSILTLFGFKLLYGDPGTALNRPDKLVLTDEMAVKYFGRKDVVGERLTVQSFSGSKKDFTIGGVMKEPPYNTVTHFGSGPSDNHFFLPSSSMKFFGRDGMLTDWSDFYIISYVKLAPGVKPEQLDAPIRQLLNTNVPENIRKEVRVYLTGIHDYYLQSNDDTPVKMISALALIAIFILLMAVINFVNMTLGNSVTRLREIGMRKVLGSQKRQLVWQFLTESLVTVFVAALLAAGGYLLARPFFSDMLGRNIPSALDLPVVAWLIPVGLTVFIGVLAGLYPALALSSHGTIGSLKGKLNGIGDKKTLRHILLTLQFVSAIVVLVAALTIREQVSFFFHTDLGYKKDRIVTTTVPRDWTPDGVTRMAASRDQFRRNPAVEDASFSFEIPDGNAGDVGMRFYLPSRDSTTAITTTELKADERFASTYQIPLVAGTMFRAPDIDPHQLVLNESAVKALGFKHPGDAIGQPIRMLGLQSPFIIGGVIKDFHFYSMQYETGPLVIIHPRAALTFRYMTFRLRPGDLPGQIASLQHQWSEVFPDAPFDYTFLDDTLRTMYDTEIRMDKAAGAATAASLVIVLLGVFGIVSLSLTRRTKEIGIRKVLGATIPQIIQLFTKEFLLLLVLANVIAWPLAYLWLRHWLDQYTYSVGLTIVPFAAAGGGMALLVTAVIAVRALRTARANPVTSLRTE